MQSEWTELALLQLQTGKTASGGVRPGGGAGLSGAGRPVRKLVAAAGRDPGRADVRLVSIAGVAIANMDINIFTQVGFVVLIGLACKNAILIVEFAKYRRGEGVAAREAVMQACQLRLRPILMTSFAFILGVLPLVVATGAGAEMRRLWAPPCSPACSA